MRVTTRLTGSLKTGESIDYGSMRSPGFPSTALREILSGILSWSQNNNLLKSVPTRRALSQHDNVQTGVGNCATSAAANNSVRSFARDFFKQPCMMA